MESCLTRRMGISKSITSNQIGKSQRLHETSNYKWLKNMNAKYIIEWTFTPDDYFEEPQQIKGDYYVMSIENGKVKAEVEVEEENHLDGYQICNDLHQSLNNRFLGVQIMTHENYELSTPSLVKLLPDGRKNYYLKAKPIHLFIKGTNVDFQHRDKNGNIVADTRRARIEKKKRNAERVARYKAFDTVLETLVNSYHTAVKNPDYELVHLYEIRDALQKHFTGKDKTIHALGLAEKDWDRLGTLANHEPIRQGRHVGQHIGNLRDATETELKEARAIAFRMIEAYLGYLERKQ